MAGMVIELQGKSQAVSVQSWSFYTWACWVLLLVPVRGSVTTATRLPLVWCVLLCVSLSGLLMAAGLILWALCTKHRRQQQLHKLQQKAPPAADNAAGSQHTAGASDSTSSKDRRTHEAEEGWVCLIPTAAAQCCPRMAQQWMQPCIAAVPVIGLMLIGTSRSHMMDICVMCA